MPVVRPGQTLGAYRLIQRISRGGMGEVWRAERSGPEGWGFKKQLAVKIILPTLNEPRFTEMFLAEARIAGRLDHPNIVYVYDCGAEGADGPDLLWIAQEYIDGMDLRSVVGDTRGLPIPLVLFIVTEALKGLAYAHAQRVIHRDVKPHNVLVGYEGHVKLTDFGIAKVLSETGASKSTISGTAGYIAPEVLAGEPATARSDLFGLGLVLWESLTGAKLFDGETEETRLKRTLDCVVPPLSAAGVSAPPEVEAIVRRLLARDPAARYATAADALAALLAAPGARAATCRSSPRLAAFRAV
jgi:serine/threonine-protein kinase